MTSATRIPELATKKDPGSISAVKVLPVLLLNYAIISKASLAIASGDITLSKSPRATLKPPPKLRTSTCGNCFSIKSKRYCADLSQ